MDALRSRTRKRALQSLASIALALCGYNRWVNEVMELQLQP